MRAPRGFRVASMSALRHHGHPTEPGEALNRTFRQARLDGEGFRMPAIAGGPCGHGPAPETFTTPVIEALIPATQKRKLRPST